MAYISADEVREIRNALKARFGKMLKFSVRNDNHSRVNVTIKNGSVDFSDILDNYGQASINHFWLGNYGEHTPLFEEILEIIKTSSSRKWFDKSDIQTDYFHTSFYINMQIGDWRKPYELTA